MQGNRAKQAIPELMEKKKKTNSKTVDPNLYGQRNTQFVIGPFSL
jgi:hypothetical protein